MALPKCTGKFNSADSNPIAEIGVAKMKQGNTSVKAWMQKESGGKRKPQHMVKPRV